MIEPNSIQESYPIQILMENMPFHDQIIDEFFLV